ncbi:DinB family protein [Laceyella putida]|uniref:DinB family protein n=1 Tax=Laceyella putida TaxID=110101 RepID=A0ABW2RMB5_9BACL
MGTIKSGGISRESTNLGTVWANQKLFDHLKELPQNIYNQEMQSVLPSISKAFSHIYVVDHIWLKVMSGERFESIRGMMDKLEEETKGERRIRFFAAYLSGTKHFSGNTRRWRSLFPSNILFMGS